MSSITSKRKRVLFYGDLGIDIIVEADQSPQLGRDAFVRDMHTFVGGSAANSAVVASCLNLDAYFMGLIGDDMFKDALLHDLNLHNVKLDHLREVKGKNTLIFVIVNDTGERTFYSYRGVNGAQQFGEIRNGFTKAFDCVHISGYSMQAECSKATAFRLIEDARANHVLLSLDPSDLFAKSDYGSDESFITNFDIVIPNLDEAMLMSKQTDVVRAARTIRRMGAKIVIVKMGREGCFLSSEETEVFIPAYSLRHIENSIGAGDAFCAGFLSGFLNGLSLENSARIANAAAHFVILGKGGHSNTPNLENVLDLIAGYEGIRLSYHPRF